MQNKGAFASRYATQHSFASNPAKRHSSGDFWAECVWRLAQEVDDLNRVLCQAEALAFVDSRRVGTFIWRSLPYYSGMKPGAHGLARWEAPLLAR